MKNNTIYVTMDDKVYGVDRNQDLSVSSKDYSFDIIKAFNYDTARHTVIGIFSKIEKERAPMKFANGLKMILVFVLVSIAMTAISLFMSAVVEPSPKNDISSQERAAAIAETAILSDMIQMADEIIIETTEN